MPRNTTQKRCTRCGRFLAPTFIQGHGGFGEVEIQGIAHLCSNPKCVDAMQAADEAAYERRQEGR